MSRTRPRRVQSAPPVEQPGPAADDLPPPCPPRRRKWLLAISIVLWIGWLAFLLMMALAK